MCVCVCVYRLWRGGAIFRQQRVGPWPARHAWRGLPAPPNLNRVEGVVWLSSGSKRSVSNLAAQRPA